MTWPEDVKRFWFRFEVNMFRSQEANQLTILLKLCLSKQVKWVKMLTQLDQLPIALK